MATETSMTRVFKIVRDTANSAQLWVIEKLEDASYRCRRMNFSSDETARQARYLIQDARRPYFDTESFLVRAMELGCDDESVITPDSDHAIAFLCRGTDQSLIWNARTMLKELDACVSSDKSAQPDRLCSSTTKSCHA